jgi:hypothetical protein
MKRMSDKVVVTFADGAGNYRRAMDRMEQSLITTGWDGDFLPFTDYEEIGSPTHKGSPDSVPYAFKAYSIKKAMELGYKYILWCDSVIFATKSVEPIFDHIKKFGYLFFDNPPFTIGEYTSDACLKHWYMNRYEAYKKKMIMACVMGFDVEHAETKRFLELYISAASDGVSYQGSWHNHNGQTSSDPKCKGHRHDQSTASIIIAREGMRIINAQETYFAYTSHKGVLPIANSVGLWSEGI